MTEALRRWAAEAMPATWRNPTPEILVDNDEILLIVTVPEPTEAVTPNEAQAAIAAFRQATRAERILLAAEVEERFKCKVSWGGRCGEVTEMFTIASIPVMTRLRFPERAVLDTLIDSGLARSRSEALAWCVRLVGANEAEWIAELRAAFEAVAEVRDRGPRSTRDRRP